MAAYTSNTVFGPPTSGTFTAGDTFTDAGSKTYVCIRGGVPGVWTTDPAIAADVLTEAEAAAIYAPKENPTFTGTGGSGYPIILAQSYVAVTAPAADTNENILATITIPAGAMGLNGALRILALFTQTNNANAKTLRFRLGGIGGTAMFTLAAASAASANPIVLIANRGAANSQIANAIGAGNTGLGASVNANTTGAIDTSAATTLVITAQKTTGTDTVTLEGYAAELIKP